MIAVAQVNTGLGKPSEFGRIAFPLIPPKARDEWDTVNLLASWGEK
jgi:hypothetical protein